MQTLVQYIYKYKKHKSALSEKCISFDINCLAFGPREFEMHYYAIILHVRMIVPLCKQDWT